MAPKDPNGASLGTHCRTFRREATAAHGGITQPNPNKEWKPWKITPKITPLIGKTVNMLDPLSNVPSVKTILAPTISRTTLRLTPDVSDARTLRKKRLLKVRGRTSNPKSTPNHRLGSSPGLFFGQFSAGGEGLVHAR